MLHENINHGFDLRGGFLRRPDQPRLDRGGPCVGDCLLQARCHLSTFNPHVPVHGRKGKGSHRVQGIHGVLGLRV